MTEWISVQDDLPPDEEQVIVLVKCVNADEGYPTDKIYVLSVYEAQFNRRRGWWVYFGRNNKQVHYWMPMPKKPELT